MGPNSKQSKEPRCAKAAPSNPGASGLAWSLPVLAMAEAAPSRACPNCKTPVKTGDIICIRCGTNLLTGQRIVAEAPREKPSRNLPPILPILGIGALAAGVVVVLGLLVFLWLQDPVADARRIAQGGNVLEALNVLQEHTEKRPDDADAQFLLGKLLWRSQQYNDAATAFDTAARLNPANAEAGMFSAAAHSRTTGQGNKTAQINALRFVLEHHPDHQEARYLLALALGSSDNLPEFASLLHTLAQDPEQIEARQYQGIAEALQGDIESASALVREALERSGSADAQAAMGAISQMQGNPEQAKALLREAIASGSSVTALLQAQLGLMLLAEGENESALSNLREAVEAPMTPNLIRFYYGLALQSVGLGTESLVQYERIVSAGLPLAHEASAQMALIYLQQDNLQKAEDTLRNATQGGAGSAKIHTLQGQLYARQGNIPEAQQALRRAVQLDESYAPARLENGLLFVSRGMLAEGLRELEIFQRLAEASDSTVPEIDVLVGQLRQTMDNAEGTAREGATRAINREGSPS